MVLQLILLSCHFHFVREKLTNAAMICYVQTGEAAKILGLDMVVVCTDYGCPIKPFFVEIPDFCAWADNLGRQILGVFRVFSDLLSAPNLVLRVPCPCFSLINHYFNKKLHLYKEIPNVYLGLGFEFGPQRIRDLAIVCP